jgi:hypothetical protein
MLASSELRLRKRQLNLYPNNRLPASAVTPVVAGVDGTIESTDLVRESKKPALGNPETSPACFVNATLGDYRL